MLAKFQGTQIPDSVRQGQRVAQTMGQSQLLVAQSTFKFAQHGQSGTWVSELLPHTAKIVDDITVIKTMNTEAINHDPAITFIQTGFQQPGRPSMGAWLSYGLGSENQNLPAFVVLLSQAHAINTDQPLFSRLWASGFLPSSYQGVRFRAGSAPVLFLDDPPGVSKTTRRQMLDALAKLDAIGHEAYGDPEIETRIASVRDGVSHADLGARPDGSVEGARLGVRDVRAGIAKAGNLRGQLPAGAAARGTQRPVHPALSPRLGSAQGSAARSRAAMSRHRSATAALITDLKQRGLLDDTLVIWGGEFGRTVFSQGKLTDANYGRDHHPRNFCMWVAGGGMKRGAVIGETDDYSYNIVSDPVSVYDLQATILHALGIDHKKLTYRFQGRDFRLTDVHGEVVEKMLA